jgi:FkbM family methyltransferase
MIENFVKYIDDFDLPYIIFDLGSRDCQQSIEFYHRFPNSKIYAFECNPNTLPICRRNINKYRDRIILIEGAVSNCDGETTFYPIDQKKTVTTWEDGNPGASSMYKSNGTYDAENYVQYEISTNCHRLDTIMEIYNIDKVDMIWMDLQGAELLALESLDNHIENVKFIYTEVSYKPIYDGQVMFDQLHHFMLEKKFKLQNELSFRGWQEDAIYANIR